MVPSNQVGVSNPTLLENIDATGPPPAHHGAVEGALASGFATAELHHLSGHDQNWRCRFDNLAEQNLSADQGRERDSERGNCR
ncbi:hypothetical protein CN233_04930 [Sinorhizobium meliloti]|nr:hypothetical protein CN233_04930 [Sinorhizobium meliloti]RVG56157.1 hypothetical protein CN226_04200 [Sinorhizobium meliloti]RVI05690.1 hypothetical protein CN205_16455 [Sinorhizobium meliloti]RVL03344.1 hypothetical protein CN152_07770 [Sinorhizobium meliloti]RVM50547.1 hypothetical protein CN127_13480 [Sinorhizobium meliloti]